MRSLGVDIGSVGLSAIVIAENNVPLKGAVWKPDNKNDSSPVRAVAFEKWLAAKLFAWSPDVVVIEETLSIGPNPRSPLQLAKREGVAELVAGRRKNCIVISAKISSSRSIVLTTPEKKGGNLKKEVAFDVFKKLYPDFKLLPKTVGGMDMADAAVHALAASTHLERR